jgi:hypothetical protein
MSPPTRSDRGGRKGIFTSIASSFSATRGARWPLRTSTSLAPFRPDRGRREYRVYSDAGNYGQSGLTLAEARINADSYAWFVWLLAPYNMRMAVPEAPPL